ncbi:DNA repair protein RadC [Candidatus Woesearchaeota archaeon]|nr:DNA repair protein RadC [Candidatus Woesearchaeota archaeon]
MGILDMPWYDRPGNRLIKEGAEILTDSELLEILLGKTKKESVVKLANRLLKKYNFNKLEELGFQELKRECKNDGIAALKILSFIELSKRYSTLKKGGYSKKPITSARDIYNIMSDKVKGYKKEILFAIMLDTSREIINIKKISVGILNSTLVHPREVFKEAIKESSDSIILVHNHPRGNSAPSQPDIEATNILIESGRTLSIPVLDHIIIGRGDYYSFAEKGKLAGIAKNYQD